MRIVHIIQRDNPYDGGAVRVAQALCAEQCKNGHDVFIIALYDSDRHLTFREPSVMFRIKAKPGVLHWIGNFMKLKSCLKEINPQIIHCHDGVVWPRLVLMFRKCPVIVHGHLLLKRDTFIRKVTAFLLKRSCDTIIAISRSVYDSFLPLGNRLRYVLVPNGVDFDRYHANGDAEKKKLKSELKLPADKKILIWCGRVHAVKGPERAWHLAKLLPEDWCLLFVGDGPALAQLHTPENLQLVDRGKIIETGCVDSTARYLQAADAYLFCAYWEDFGLVIVEAAACDLPILSYGEIHGGATELLRKFDAQRISEDDFADILSHVGRKVHPGIADFSWDAVNREVEKIYSESLRKDH